MPSDPSAEPTEKPLDPAQSPIRHAPKNRSQGSTKPAKGDLPDAEATEPVLLSIFQAGATTTDITPQALTSSALLQAARPGDNHARIPADAAQSGNGHSSIKAWSGLGRTGADHAERVSCL